MTDPADYVDLPESARQQARTAAYTRIGRAAEDYADLLAAEAGISARAVLPAVVQIGFRLTDDVTGPSASLVVAYDEQGSRVWHLDRDGDWPGDESLVTDYLAAAARWCPTYFGEDTNGYGQLLFSLDS